MGRIRNRLRFQSPEERILNGLLVVLLAVLAVVGVSKWRDDQAVGATEVRGIQITRPTPRLAVTSTSSSTMPTTTPSAPALDPVVIWHLAVADAQRHRSASDPATPPTTSAAPPFGFPTTAPPFGFPTTTTSTRPSPTTTTTRPSPTTTTTTTTTTAPAALMASSGT